MAKINLSSSEYLEQFAQEYKNQSTLLNHFFFEKPLKELHSLNITMTNYVWPLGFYANLSIFSSTKNDIETKLQDAYKKIDEVPQFDVDAMMRDKANNLPVVAHRDQKWNRGLLKVLEKDKAVVYYVDTGRQEYVNWKNIRPLYKQFVEWPPLAFNCKLNGLEECDVNEKVTATLQKAMPAGRTFFCHVLNWNNMQSILMDVYLGETNKVNILDQYLAELFKRKRQQQADRMRSQQKMQEEKMKRRMLLGDDYDSSDED
ncbi:Tudor domain-containing protein 1 [Trichinella murrelli]|uniref:Tudor domain-containing protein 1 n=1 Tax=Trichinella murrelli TaxID=144512 RepID=A0A0V0TME0_9BILA|nr:Tudor domain-containing protein 1 [Trichinella murrelli]